MSYKKIKLPNGEIRWETSFHLNGRNSTKTRKRFLTEKEARSFELETRKVSDRQIAGGFSPQELDSSSFEKESSYWMETRKRNLSPGHLKRVQGILKDFISRYGSLRPMEFHLKTMHHIQNEYMERGLSRNSVNRVIEVIKAVLNFSAQSGRIPFHPCQGFKKLRPERKHFGFWSLEEAKSFLKFAANKYPENSEKRWIFLVYLLSINTGLRAGEVWELRSKDFLQEKGLIKVRGQYDRVSRTVRCCKGKDQRYLPCNKNLKLELEAWCLMKGLSENDLIFSNENGHAICHENFVRRSFLADVKESKIRRIRFHDLRHTAATLMISSGIEPNTVKEILGHQNITTTMIYVHLLADSIVSVANNFSISA